MTEAMTLAARIADAEAKLHLVETGQAVEMTTHEGVSVKYTPADAPRLRAYIARLKNEQAGRPARGALAVRFKG